MTALAEEQTALRFHITAHAVEQFEERARDWLRGNGADSHWKVTTHIDARCVEAEKAGLHEDVSNLGRHTRVFDISGKDFGRLYAVARPNVMGTPAEWAIITILTGSMYDNQFRNGAWKPIAKAVPTPASPVRAVPVAAQKGTEPHVYEAPTEAASGESSANGGGFLFLWVDANGVRCQDEGTREQVAEAMEAAHSDGGHSFRVFAEVPLQTKTITVFEF